MKFVALARTCLCLATLLLMSCADTHYAKIKTGKFKGRLTVEWVGHDNWIYRPDPKEPLEFIRHNGEVIRPQAMSTDGGSIPRQLWIFKNYSPWGYGPGYIMHDWLFTAHHLHVAPDPRYSLDETADILAECIKTLMVSGGPGGDIKPDKFALYSIDLAVRSPVAKNLWDRKSSASDSVVYSSHSSTNISLPLSLRLNTSNRVRETVVFK